MEVKGHPGMVSHDVRKVNYNEKGRHVMIFKFWQTTTNAYTRIVFCNDWNADGTIYIIPSGTETG